MKVLRIVIVTFAVANIVLADLSDIKSFQDVFQKILNKRNEKHSGLLRTQKQRVDTDAAADDNGLLQVFGHDMRVFLNTFRRKAEDTDTSVQEQNEQMLGAELGDVSAECFGDYATAIANLNVSSTSSLDVNNLWAISSKILFFF